jgi:hypothetical protein
VIGRVLVWRRAVGPVPRDWNAGETYWAKGKLEWRLNDVKMTWMKRLPKMEISDDLDARINEVMEVSELCKADVVRQALKIGLPQFVARFQPPPLWLEERIREALLEPAEPQSAAQFDKTMKAIADGR